MSSKFRFKIQPYQTDAVNAVAGVFKGQPYSNAAKYTRDMGKKKKYEQIRMDESADDYGVGFANAPLMIDDDILLDNLKTVQYKYNVDRMSEEINKELGNISLDVEMETGTGKTYVYIKTMFELNQRYGWNKFIIVVPSVAIREGVDKSFDQMRDHFMNTYKKTAQKFIYDSKDLTRLDAFSSSNDIQVMIINYQAFNSTKNSNIIDTVTERFQDRKPIDVISSNRPILILDEPQKLKGKATQAGLKKFKSLFAINYSATHVIEHNLVYQLDALAAYNQFLVKKIEVKGFDIKNLKGTGKYLYLQDIILSDKESPKAKIEFEHKKKSGDVQRITRILSKNDNIYDYSGKMDQYADRYVIMEIDGREGFEEIVFANGERLRIKEASGFKEEKDLRRVQIRETIASHFDKEAKILYKKRIKCLSLFFIDEVAKYKSYGNDGEEIKGEYAIMFEQEYLAELERRLETDDSEYKKYLIETCSDVTKVRQGYFSIDKNNKAIDSKGDKATGESDDISAYDLILKDKERLLSFEEPTRFIFSHSALREGWDNPNVFQICTLKKSDSNISKRQEIGRGLRISRNFLYDLVDRQYTKSDKEFHKINKLTVIATDSYKDFVKAFQDDLSKVLKNKPTQANEEFFEGKLLFGIDDNKVTVNNKMARSIYKYLLQNEYIDDNDGVNENYRNALHSESLVNLPEALVPYAESVHKLIQGVYNPALLKGMLENGNLPKKAIKPNKNFDKAEFKALWNEINHMYAYTVDFESGELVSKVVDAVNVGLRVSQLQYTVTWSEQRQKLDSKQIKQHDVFYGEKTKTRSLQSADSDIDYDLVGKIAGNATLTRKTVVEILTKICSEKFAMFKTNPEEFISNVSKIIKEQKATTLVDHIEYNITDGKYDSDIFTLQKTEVEYESGQDSVKHILNKVFVDSDVESKLAKIMDGADEVVVYAKLPRTFQIPTPVGNYAPDWAIAFKDSAEIKHIYFIAETKGKLNSMHLTGDDIQDAKIKCARKLFNNLSTSNVKYDAIENYSELLALVK